jgi:hypothetical protein
MAVLIIALFGSPDADLAPIDPAVPHERIASPAPGIRRVDLWTQSGSASGVISAIEK